MTPSKEMTQLVDRLSQMVDKLYDAMHGDSTGVSLQTILERVGRVSKGLENVRDDIAERDRKVMEIEQRMQRFAEGVNEKFRGIHSKLAGNNG